MAAEYMDATNIDKLADKLREALTGRTWIETRSRVGWSPSVSRCITLESIAVSANGCIYLNDSDGTLPLRAHSGTSFEFNPTSVVIRFTADDGAPVAYLLEFQQ